MRLPLALILVLTTAPAFSQIYRWTDEKGRVHLTDTPPPAGAKEVQKRSGNAGPVGEPYAVQVARTNYPVTLYTAPECAPCAEARKLLNERAVPFTEVSVTDQAQIDQLKRQFSDLSLPSIAVGPTRQAGFDPALYQRMLDSAGYPKTGALPPRKPAEK